MEELDFKGLLDQFNSRGFQKGEQVILGNFGTVQTLLSIIFGTPCNVHDIKMEEKDSEIFRLVNLRAEAWDYEVVCQATSRIPVARNRFDVVQQVTASQLGLGQIVVKSEIPNKRTLVELGRDSKAFWRTYNIEGPDLFITIHEHFPREPFEKVGWILREVDLRSPHVKKIEPET